MKKKFDIVTMTPLVNTKKATTNRRRVAAWCPDFYWPAVCVSCYNVILIMSLPFTARGLYGNLRIPGDGIIGDVANMPVVLEVFLISLFSLANLIGFINVIKRSALGLAFYEIVHYVQLLIAFIWCSSADIKSHFMSQYVLGWCAIIGIVMQMTSAAVMTVFCRQLSERILD